MTAQCVRVGDRTLVADGCGILFWPARSTLLVADLHLEKGAHFAGRGSFLPPYDTRETLHRLESALARYAPARVVALGDSFHAAQGAIDIADADLERLLRMQEGREWIWIAGNHDPEIAARVGGSVAREITLDGVVLRHAPEPGFAGREIAGHLHPVARLAGRGMTLRRRCFIGDGTRVVLPAFGAFTGGLNVRDAAFADVFARSARLSVLMLGEAGLYPVPLRSLRPD
ncbi:MAG: ligase-associated DNA damage response endonuclease PdeM [Hyphomicrobiaceae bacterium]|nr:ligase-associated DNA damage response endonuclease PdeM [Hyphomicrobiaceae bacterium]